MQEVTHKSIIRSLTPAQREDLLARSDLAGLRHLAIYLGGIAVCTGLILAEGLVPFWGVPLVMLVQGILIVFLFTLLHETVHQTPFRSEWLNVWVGRFCGFLVFLGPVWFRYFHFAHHRFTNEPGKDPELAEPRPATVWQYLKYLSGLPETVARIKILLINAVRDNRDDFVSEKGRIRVKREARVQVLLYVVLIALSVYFETDVLAMVWLLPFLMGGPFLRAYLLAEHAGCPHVPSMLENTRTTYTNALVRFLAWNMPYHVEHHTYPAVPFHKLPTFHEHTKAHLARTERGYGRFNIGYLKTCRA